MEPVAEGVEECFGDVELVGLFGAELSYHGSKLFVVFIDGGCVCCSSFGDGDLFTLDQPVDGCFDEAVSHKCWADEFDNDFEFCLLFGVLNPGVEYVLCEVSAF